MRYRSHRFLGLLLMLVCIGTIAFAQTPQRPGDPLTLGNAPQRDTNANKSNTSDWQNYNAHISYKLLNSEKVLTPDTTLHTFHRRPYSQPWYRDLGNLGSPSRNLLFTPENRLGPTLGYHIFDVYRYNVDSLLYYNTNRPYSRFIFQLGSKLEQNAEIFHTQNISPNWNIAVNYRKLTSPGFYQIQRTNDDNGNISTNYQSKDQHYNLYAGVVYNKQQQDENGGILGDSLLLRSDFSDRRTIPVRFQNDAYGNLGSNRRSPVTNMQREFTLMLNHSYTFGKTDTLYNEDSTSFRTELTPRFGVSHRMQMTSEKHAYKDFRPDSLKYIDFMNRAFLPNGQDTLSVVQKWFMIDNRFLLNGFIGKRDNPLAINAGIGGRYDNFNTEYAIGNNSESTFSTYLTGEIKKEALKEGAWEYKANALFYVTGQAIGSSQIGGEVGKGIGKNFGAIVAGAKQSINYAPYAYQYYQSAFDTITASFNKESVTQIYARVDFDELKLSLGFSNYLIANYIYLNEKQLPDQYGPAFNISQLTLRKVFMWRSVVFDNEVALQQLAGDAPINVPQLMGRHQLSLERYILKNALKVATGVEVRYHSNYKPSGYSPFFNRFYYQNTYTVSNAPEASVFFNFKVKRFRAYFMLDQLQQFITRNTISAPGYPNQDFMIRFGFNWVMIN
ncbi:MAG: hypothetical protein EOP51_05865 [Sphingobacteriales bacterium]|nr:MAG: hypothetical protein EOP51_05865 [Sphingobacteriales bacterium]